MKLYGTIEKVEDQDDGTILVSGYASSESVDSDGEVIKASAMEAALPDYMKFANVREMHQPKAAGIALEAGVQDDGRTWLKTHIVDAEAVKKVKTGVYKGFSIGGRVTQRDDANKNIITGIRLSEISLVDRPANPSAVFECWKGDGLEGEKNMTDKSTQESAKAEAVESLRKYTAEESFDAQTAINALISIQFLLDGETQEDGEPASQAADLRAAIERLKSFIASEIMENVPAQGEGENDVAYAARCADLAKRGSRHSKKDAKQLQAIHDHASEIHKACMTLGMGGDADKADDADDLAKLSGDLAVKADALAKVEAENADLKKRVAELESQPREVKGALRAVPVTKADDVQSQSASVEDDLEKAMKDDDPLTLIKIQHKHFGKKVTV